MKYLILLFLFIPILFTSQNAGAMIIKIDSVYADSCYQDGIFGVSSGDSARIFHKPDSNFAHLSGTGPIIDIAFKKFKKNEIQPIEPTNSYSPPPMLLVWGKKDSLADSSAGQLTFNRYDESLGMLITSSPVILTGGLQTITIPTVPGLSPKATWQYVEITLAGNEIKHATSFFVDALALLQDTVPPVSVPFQPSAPNAISSYPNPFIANTTIHFSLASGGDAQLLVIDGLGRELDHINAGYLESGVHDIPLAIRTPGFYFVRLVVNGESIGYPLKISSL
jgi:hypothetical protein